MDDEGKRLGLSILDNAMLAAELTAGVLGQGGLPAQAPLLDDASCQAVVQPVEPPDWVMDAPGHRQEQLIEAGNEAEALPVPEQVELAPPAEPMGLF